MGVGLEMPGDAAAGITVEQLVATAESVPADDEASTTVEVTQAWYVDYLVPEGGDASDLAARLEQTCQEATSGCVLVSGRRRALRRALQDDQDASTLTATLSRPLDPAGGGHLDDPIVASLALYKSNGVTATSERLKAVTVQLTVTSPNPNPDPNPN